MTSRMPPELRMSREDLIQARESSRWAVELAKMKRHASGMDYQMKGTEGKIAGIEFTVHVDSDSTNQSDTSEVRLRLILPDEYPNSIPKVYPVNMRIPFDHNAHLYRDRKGDIHLCIIRADEWTSDCTLTGMMVLSSLWVHKYLVWRNTGIWPGRGRPHCIRCGRIGGCEHT
jgi:ubiquitin-protein ligase